MEKKPKNLSENLTDYEKEILDRLELTYLAKFYSLQEKYPDAKVYAKRKLLSKMKSDSSLALCHTLLFIKDLTSNISFTPKELNKKLAEEIPITLKNSKVKSYKINEGLQKKFISSTALREQVLEPLEKDQNVLRWQNNDNSKEYKKPGKKPSGPKIDKRGGRSSFYMTRSHIEEAKQILKRPQAIDYLHDKILKSGLALKVTNYQILTIFHLMKMTNGKDAVRLINLGESNSQTKLTPTSIDALKNLLPQLFQRLDDRMLENLAEKVSNLLIQDKEYYKQFLPITIFMKL